jgi:hypothetical protein
MLQHDALSEKEPLTLLGGIRSCSPAKRERSPLLVSLEEAVYGWPASAQHQKQVETLLEYPVRSATVERRVQPWEVGIREPMILGTNLRRLRPTTPSHCRALQT